MRQKIAVALPAETGSFQCLKIRRFAGFYRLAFGAEMVGKNLRIRLCIGIPGKFKIAPPEEIAAHEGLPAKIGISLARTVVSGAVLQQQKQVYARIVAG